MLRLIPCRRNYWPGSWAFPVDMKIRPAKSRAKANGSIQIVSMPTGYLKICDSRSCGAFFTVPYASIRDEQTHSISCPLCRSNFSAAEEEQHEQETTQTIAMQAPKRRPVKRIALNLDRCRKFVELLERPVVDKVRSTHLRQP